MADITSPDYWNSRYLDSNTPWDIGYASPPIIEYMEKKVEKSARILIPGAGNAHEAAWLWENGYRNTWVVDIAEKALENIKEGVPEFPESHLLHKDFFALEEQFDIVVEQTFFCALPPDWRPKYVSKMREVLSPEGLLFGVLFKFPLTSEGPPFGGSKEEYEKLFVPHFKIQKMELCRNSIKPRMGNELFFELQTSN
jgi:SAM-dependent methyltransferase